MCGKIFKFMVFTFLENTVNLGIFTYAPCSPLRTPGTTKETGGEKNHLLYQNSIIKYRDDTEH